MNILLASSEVVPFSKTGGLADVCGALPIKLAELGQQVTVISPAYRHVHATGAKLEKTGLELEIPIGSKLVRGTLLRGTLPASDVPIYFVAQDDYFDRPELYREQGEDYKDNCERFVFFSRAVLESIRLLNLPVDLLHVNDWQTGLAPALLAIEYANQPGYEQIASLLTIHNLAYQGQFWHWDMLLTGLDWKYFNWHQMEFYGQLNLMKTGIVFADSINTVSQRYAEEIQSHPLGCGLEGVLQQRRDALSGVLNGIDYDQWNPATDKHLAAHYSADQWTAGKAQCKAALQRELGLPEEPQTPIIGFIGRLADQKGVDLLMPLIESWVETTKAQWVILGTGEPEYHRRLEILAADHPRHIGLRLTFSDALAHRIEAGSDLFLMPSAYEPCGLNQMYSLRYGTVPIVRETGGLADTITDISTGAVAANGFSFHEYSLQGLEHAMRRALDLYRDSERWNQLVETCMRQDWSWSRSAARYVELYEQTVARHQQSALSH